MVIKVPTTLGEVSLDLLTEGENLDPVSGIHTLEWLAEKFPMTYKYERMHAKLAALKFRYAVLESHGEKISRDTLEKDMTALQELAEYCVNNG